MATTAAIDVIKSPNDKKQYRYLQLENGLSVLLIHDPEMLAFQGENDAQEASRQDALRTEVLDDKSEDSGNLMSEVEDEGEDVGEEEESEETESQDEESGHEGEAEEVHPGHSAKTRGKHGVPVKKAAAAMAVGVGSFSDPEELPGLSHYLEHMLFMGSKKYPNENDYDDYLTKHGGASNAFTELEYTNYHFEVAPDALQGAIDRFAQFFIAPLCLESSLEREVCAVDSEFSGVLQNDHCRLCQVMCHTARQGHAYRKFTWGNKKSLWEQPRLAGLDVRQAVMDYYKRHYSAERMALVLLGGQPLDELQRWVQDSFAELPRGAGPCPTFAHLPMPFEGRSLCLMKAVKEFHEVVLTFQLPSLLAQYGKKADHYISHLVGHEGPGSLLSELKARGWATDLSAGVDEDGYSHNTCCCMFSINVTLTDAGLAAAPGCGLAAVELAFQYLRMLRDAGPQEWVWQEMKGVADLKWRFQEEEDGMEFCSRIAGSAHRLQPQHLLIGDSLHEYWDPKLVKELLDFMHPHAEGCAYRVDVMTRSYDTVRDRLAEVMGARVSIETEPWFNMEVSRSEIPSVLSEMWASSSVPPSLHLPPANPYIPTDFSVRSESADMDVDQQGVVTVDGKEVQLPIMATPPVLVLDEPGLMVWHKLDVKFCTPRANAYFRIAPREAHHSTPRAAALMHLMLQLTEDALNEDTYLADVAGLHYSISPEGQQGFEVRVDGFSHKLPVLVERIFRCLAAGSFGAAGFAVVHEALTRKYRNMCMHVAKHASYTRLYSLCAHAWHADDILAELAGITLADVQPFVQALLKDCHIECLLHGNLTQQEALTLASQVRDTVGSRGRLSAALRPRDACVQLQEGVRVIIREPAKNPEEENCAVEHYFQLCPATSPRDRACLDLLDQAMYEPCYDTLRTREQLGYTVHSGTRLTHGILGFCFMVVSAQYPAEHVASRIEIFLASFEAKLRSMSLEELQKHKDALAANKLQQDRNLTDESSRHWEQISSQRYDFFSRELEIAAVQELQLEDIVSFFINYLSPTTGGRKMLLVHIRPQKQCTAASSLQGKDAAYDHRCMSADAQSNSVSTAPADVNGESHTASGQHQNSRQPVAQDDIQHGVTTAEVTCHERPQIIEGPGLQELNAYRRSRPVYPSILMRQPSLAA